GTPPETQASLPSDFEPSPSPFLKTNGRAASVRNQDKTQGSAQGAPPSPQSQILTNTIVLREVACVNAVARGGRRVGESRWVNHDAGADAGSADPGPCCQAVTAEGFSAGSVRQHALRVFQYSSAPSGRPGMLFATSLGPRYSL